MTRHMSVAIKIISEKSTFQKLLSHQRRLSASKNCGSHSKLNNFKNRRLKQKKSNTNFKMSHQISHTITHILLKQIQAF